MQDNISNSKDLTPNVGDNALKKFQLSGDTKDKTSEKYGKKIIYQVEQIINSGYFAERNIRFALNRAMFTGRMDINKFKDFFNINGITNYVNINWKSIMIVNTIISRLVGRWMTKKYKASVTAVDEISTKKKQDEVDKADFYMSNKDMLQQLANESGVQMIPQDQFIPDDKDHLDLWAKDELRVPEEILMAMGINGVFDENGWGDMGINTRKHKVDAAVVGLIGKETIADKNGHLIDKYCKPENMFYSYSERDDFKDASIKGVIESYKMSDLRYEYPNLDIKQLWEIATTSKQWQYADKIRFDPNWNVAMFLPFDDWNVDVVRFTLKSLDTDKSLIKTAKDGSLYVDKPKKRVEDVYPGNEYIEKTVWNIYRGVYARTPDKIILEWGLENNMVRPQDYEKIAEVESPYSFYMYQNDKMRNLAIPEKIEAPVEMMTLTFLRIQQYLALMHPTGNSYDIEGLQSIDLGNGICTPLELRKITSQTGDVYYRSKDAEGNRLETPIRPNPPNSANAQELEQLISTFNFQLEVIRNETGVNEFAEGQTIKPRTGQENVQTSLEISFNATDYINDATISCADESAGKIACLLHDSVEFGSKEYRDIMGEEDVKGRDFKVKIEMLPSTDDITKFENTVNNMMASQPDLVMYINPEKLKRIAKENVQLAETYLHFGQRRAIEGRQKQAESQSRMNAEAQKESGLAVEAAKQQSLQMELEVKTSIQTASDKEQQKLTILQGIFGIYQKGMPMPAELMPLTQEIISNVGLPLFAENIQNAQALQQGLQAQQQSAEEGQEQGLQQNPQEEQQELPMQ